MERLCGRSCSLISLARPHGTWRSVTRAWTSSGTHFLLMRRAIARCGGHEVKTIGDSIMAQFDSAVAALDCAVLMQQASARDNAYSDVPTALRVGVSMGEVADADGDVYGLPVVEASRLCEAASGGEVLVADVLRHLAGSRSTHRLVRRPPLELKGFPDPVDACEVRWEEEAVAPTWIRDVWSRRCGRPASAVRANSRISSAPGPVSAVGVGGWRWSQVSRESARPAWSPSWLRQSRTRRLRTAGVTRTHPPRTSRGRTSCGPWLAPIPTFSPTRSLRPWQRKSIACSQSWVRDMSRSQGRP